MLVDLVHTTTRDGIRLDGAFVPPAGPGSCTVGIDAFCFLHGTGGNFYSSSLLDDLGERLHALGCGVLRVNTRGHDGLSTALTEQGGRRQGAAYEVVDHCRHDIAAWLTWLRERVGPRVGLLGHSMGAVKCLYAMAHEPQNAQGAPWRSRRRGCPTRGSVPAPKERTSCRCSSSPRGTRRAASPRRSWK